MKTEEDSCYVVNTWRAYACGTIKAAWHTCGGQPSV